MAVLLPNIKQRFFDSNGDPLVGGKLYTYAAGTTTPIATYSDYELTTPNANPVILDSQGEADVWLADGNYKFVLTDADDVTQWTVDNITILADASSGGLIDKYTFAHTGFQTAGLTNSITAFSLPAKTLLESIVVKHDTAFAGTGITSYKVSVGISGNSTLFIDSFDVLQATGETVFDLVNANYIASFSNATNILITAIAVGANLDQSSAGSVEIFPKTKGLS